MSVNTKFDILFIILISFVDVEIVAKLLIVPDIAVTIHVMVIDHVCHTQRVSPEIVNIFPDMFQLDAENHVRPAGKISKICTQVA